MLDTVLRVTSAQKFSISVALFTWPDAKLAVPALVVYRRGINQVATEEVEVSLMCSGSEKSMKHRFDQWQEEAKRMMRRNEQYMQGRLRR